MGHQRHSGHPKNWGAFPAISALSLVNPIPGPSKEKPNQKRNETPKFWLWLLKRKENSSQSFCWRLEVQLCCHEKSSSWFRNFNLIPFRRKAPMLWNKDFFSISITKKKANPFFWEREKKKTPTLSLFETEFPHLLGPTNPSPTAVHIEPFPISVFKYLTCIFATTTKICTRVPFQQPSRVAFCTSSTPSYSKVLTFYSFLFYTFGQV